MPLSRTCSVKTQRKIVRKLIDEGYPSKQAVAISYSQLKRNCGVKSGQRMTPKQIVRSRRRR